MCLSKPSATLLTTRLGFDPVFNVYNPEREKTSQPVGERPFYSEPEDDEYDTQFELIYQAYTPRQI